MILRHASGLPACAALTFSTMALSCGPPACALAGVSVAAPDPFPLEGLSAADSVLLHVSGRFEGATGGFVGTGILVVDATGLWTFDQFFTTWDDSGDTNAGDCGADSMDLEFTLTATTPDGDDIDLSGRYPPVDLTENTRLTPKHLEVWDGVTISVHINQITG